MRALFAAAMMWATLSGGGSSEIASNAGAVDVIRHGVENVMGHKANYVSAWDGQRISGQAMRQVW